MLYYTQIKLLIVLRRCKKVMDTNIVLGASLKGGVGKSTCAAALADTLARKMNKKVLVIDADPQGSLSRRFGYEPYRHIDTNLDVLLQNEYDIRKNGAGEKIPVEYFFNEAYRKKPNAVIPKKYDNLHIMSTSNELENIYALYQADPVHSSSIVRKILFNIKDLGMFDYVIIDTQPALTYMLGQYLLGSDYVIIPVTPDEDAMLGAEAIGNAFNQAAEEKEEYRRYNELTLLGVFFNRVNKRTISARKYSENRGEFWDESMMFDTTIPQSQAVVNAGNVGSPVTLAYSQSPAAKAFVELAEELDKKITLDKEEQK